MNTLDHDLLLGIVVFIDNTRISTFRAVSVKFKTITTGRFTALQTRELNAFSAVAASRKINTHVALLAFHGEGQGDLSASLINDYTHILTCINSIIELCMTNDKAYDNNGKPIFAEGHAVIGNYAYNAYWSFSMEEIEKMHFAITQECEWKTGEHPDDLLEDENGYPIYIKHQDIGRLSDRMWKETTEYCWF